MLCLIFIKYIVYYKRVRARLVRRLIWVEEQLCSNHNNPKRKNMLSTLVMYLICNVKFHHVCDGKYIKKLLRINSYISEGSILVD